ncbi:MAG: 1-acyl-sn-glycerol-3-phosphate acyltransferase [Bacteroidota bacterium]
MRFLYFILKIVLQYPFRIFFSKVKLVNPDRHFFGRTIYVCNHAASFLDPLVISVLQRPIVFFMTRSDVFKPFLKPLLWQVHMLPIYREHDGEDTKAKNEAVFKTCTNILKYGRSLMIFGEGFTDDVFIRRLKPIKKGAARIGFGTLEAINWEKKIYMKAVGINYEDPNSMGANVLISNSERICLNDYKELYLQSPSKAIHDVTKQIEVLLQNQLTHVENKDWVFFHEHVSRLKRTFMHPTDSDFSIPLKKRWQNSKELAHWINEQTSTSSVNTNEENQELIDLKKDLDSYFKLLKKMKIEEQYLHELSLKNELNTSKELFKLIALSPVLIFGLIHFYLPYNFVKRFAEKTFKRRVFWSSVKLMLGFLVIALWNIPLVYLLNLFVIKNAYISLGYYLILPILGRLSYSWKEILKHYLTKKKLKKVNLSSMIEKRKNLIERIDLLCPKF